MKQKILGRIAGYSQFRQHDQIGAKLLACAIGRSDDTQGIALTSPTIRLSCAMTQRKRRGSLNRLPRQQP